MLSLSQIKSYKSLQIKKYRQNAQRFLVEGSKSVFELMKSDFEIEVILITQDYHDKYFQYFHEVSDRIEVVSNKIISRIGTLTTNESILAVAKMRKHEEPEIERGNYVLAFEDLNDPGNLGTILRIADWYGIKNIVASPDTVDFYNPKVIQSSMGSFTRISVYYCDLIPYIRNNSVPVIGTFIDGESESIHTFKFPATSIIVFGNESHGISRMLGTLVDHKLTIPRFGNAESLNVAVSCAVVLDNLKRQNR